MSAEDVKRIEEINADEGSVGFFSSQRGQATELLAIRRDLTPDALIADARRAGIPADAIIEVSAGTPAFERPRRYRREALNLQTPGL